MLSVKSLLAISLSVLAMGVSAADFSDCKKEDACTFSSCESDIVESVDNMSLQNCRKVHKLKDGKHQFDYYELKILTTLPADMGGHRVGNTIRLR